MENKNRAELSLYRQILSINNQSQLDAALLMVENFERYHNNKIKHLELRKLFCLIEDNVRIKTQELVPFY
jgi:hypothetical protein